MDTIITSSNKTFKIRTLDLHAAGEPCRVIYDYFYDIPGATMVEKKKYLTDNQEEIRRALMLEPRGHANMFGSIITRPVSPEADAGVIFLTNSGYLDMCIHGSICTSRAVVELGMKLKDPSKIVFDTVGGLVTALLTYDKNGKVSEVEIQNVPSFILNKEPIKITIPEVGELTANIVFAGNFFVVVDGDDNEKLYINPSNYDYLANIGMKIMHYVNENYDVVHPLKPELRNVSLTVIYNRKGIAPKHVKNVVVFGNKQVDRSPCGTGTSGLMVHFNSLEELGLHTPYISESIIGSQFVGQLTEKFEKDGITFLRPAVKGIPNLMARSEFILDPNDIYQFGIPVLL